MKKGISVYFILFIINTLLYSEVPTIAVLDLEGEGIEQSDLNGLSSRLRTELFNGNVFKVLERSKVTEILKEQGFQQTGCTNADCAVEVGQLLGVEYMVIGTINIVGNTYTCDIRMISMSTSEIIKVAAENCQKCRIEEVLMKTIPHVAKKLTAPNLTVNNQEQDDVGYIKSDDKDNRKRQNRFCISADWLLGFNGEFHNGPSVNFGLLYKKKHYMGISGSYGDVHGYLVGGGLNYNYQFKIGKYAQINPGGMLGFWFSGEDELYFAGLRVPFEIGYKKIYFKMEIGCLLGTGAAAIVKPGISLYL